MARVMNRPSPPHTHDAAAHTPHEQNPKSEGHACPEIAAHRNQKATEIAAHRNQKAAFGILTYFRPPSF